MLPAITITVKIRKNKTNGPELSKARIPKIPLPFDSRTPGGADPTPEGGRKTGKKEKKRTPKDYPWVTTPEKFFDESFSLKTIK
jgi:hypothetical protein